MYIYYATILLHVYSAAALLWVHCCQVVGEAFIVSVSWSSLLSVSSAFLEVPVCMCVCMYVYVYTFICTYAIHTHTVIELNGYHK